MHDTAGNRDSFEAVVWVPPRNVPLFVGANLILLGLAYERLARPVAPVGFLAAYLTVAFAVMAFTRNAYPRARRVTLRATRTSLTIGDRAPISAEEIVDARTVVYANGDAVVRLAFRSHGLQEFRMRPDDAATMLQLLGASAGLRRATFTLAATFRVSFLLSFAAITLAILVPRAVAEPHLRSVLELLPGSTVLALLLAGLANFVRGRLVIGADGFAVKWLWHERFFPFSEVQKVERPRSTHGPGDTFVTLRSGRRLRVRPRDAPTTEAQRSAELRAVYRHLSSALERARARDETARQNAAELLSRGTLTGAEWLANVDAVLRGGGARYRVAAVNSEDLAAIAKDPSAAADARVGAAAALVRMGEDGRRVARLAADACAEPKLRVLLDAVSEAESDEALAVLLAQTSPSPR